MDVGAFPAGKQRRDKEENQEEVAKDTQSLENQIKDLLNICNINLALACQCGGYDLSEKAGEDLIVVEWRCNEGGE